MTTLDYILSAIDNAKVEHLDIDETPEIWLRPPMEIGLPLAQQRLSFDYNKENYEEREVFIHIFYGNDDVATYEVTIWDNSGNEEFLFSDRKVYPPQEKIIEKFKVACNGKEG